MEFAYYNDDADMVGFRYGDWKAVFREIDEHPEDSRSGKRTLHLITVFPRSLIFVWILTNVPISFRINMTTGG